MLGSDLSRTQMYTLKRKRHRKQALGNGFSALQQIVKFEFFDVWARRGKIHNTHTHTHKGTISDGVRALHFSSHNCHSSLLVLSCDASLGEHLYLFLVHGGQHVFCFCSFCTFTLLPPFPLFFLLILLAPLTRRDKKKCLDEEPPTCKRRIVHRCLIEVLLPLFISFFFFCFLYLSINPKTLYMSILFSWLYSHILLFFLFFLFPFFSSCLLVFVFVVSFAVVLSVKPAASKVQPWVAREKKKGR